MNLRKNMLLVVGLAVAGILIAAALFFLFKFQSAYSQVKQDLDASQVQLERLQQRDPYPSKENVDLTRKQAEEKEGFSQTLLESMRTGQVVGQTMERAQYGTILESTTRTLRKQSREAGVKLPEQFAFGFDRYEKGALARTEHIPRLYTQLKTIEQICFVLFESGVKEIETVERDLFDEKRPEEEELEKDSRTSRRRQPRTRRPSSREAARPVVVKKKKSDLYEKETLTLTFYTREDGLWGLMDALATGDLFTVVTSMELTNEGALAGAGVQRGPATMGRTGRMDEDPAGEGEPVEEVKPPSRDERVVAGRERVKVKLTLDVYRFPVPAEEESEAKGE